MKYTKYYPDGSVWYEIWSNEVVENPTFYHCLKLNRHDGPARICYYLSGKVMYEEWCQNGQRHRENDLPAFIEYYENGNVKSESYWNNGKQYCPNF